MQAVPRPWTGVVVDTTGTHLVYCEASRRDEANARLAKQTNGRLVASIFGHHDRRILTVI